MGRKPKDDSETDGEDFVGEVFRIKDVIINPRHIVNMGKSDMYDEDKMAPVFNVIVNRSETEKVINGNLIIPFPSRPMRDSVFELILDRMEALKFRIHVII